MNYEASGPFITSILELKLDWTIKFDWQRHSQDCREDPHYLVLLEFLDLWAHASKNIICDPDWRHQTASPEKKLSTKLSYHVNIDDTCMACKLGKHPLYTCRKFRLLSHKQMMVILKEHEHCINCLKSGHFVKQCPCGQRAGITKSFIFPGSTLTKRLRSRLRESHLWTKCLAQWRTIHN